MNPNTPEQLPQEVTLRDFYAAAALTGLLASPNPSALMRGITSREKNNFDEVALMIADSLLITRKETTP